MYRTSFPFLIATLAVATQVARASAQSPAAVTPSQLARYETYAGNYQIAPGHIVSIGPFAEQGDRLTFYDAKTRRVGVFYEIAAGEFVSGVQNGNELLTGDIRVAFSSGPGGAVNAMTWREGNAPAVRAARVRPHRNEEVTLKNGDVVLRGTLTLPAGVARAPAIVFLHGSGPARRPAGIWPYFLANIGVATLTFDKRGAGASTGNWQTASFDDLANDALAAVALLRARGDINPRQIGLWGNSNSGWVIPIAATKSPDVAFVISRVGSGVPAYENLLWEIENTARQNGLGESEIVKAVAFRKRYNNALLTNSGWEALRHDAELVRNERWFSATRLGALFTLTIPPDANTLRTLRNPLMSDPISLWERVTVPVLAIFGELDQNVPTARSVPLLDAALKKAGNKDYKISVLRGANHGLAEVATDSTPEGRLNRRYAAGYLDAIARWLQARFDVRR